MIFRNLSIRKKLAIFPVVAVFFLLLLGAIIYFLSRDFINTSLIKPMVKQAETVSTRIDSAIAERITDHKVWSNNLAIKGALIVEYGYGEISELLTELLKLKAHLIYLVVTDTDGNIVASTDRALINKSVRETEWFREVQYGPSFVSDLKPRSEAYLLGLTEDENQYTAEIAFRILDRERHPIGVIHGAIDWQSITDEIVSEVSSHYRSLGLSSGNAFVLRKDGLIVAHTNPSLTGRNINELGLSGLLKGGQQGFLEYTEKGSEKTVGYVTSIGSGSYYGFGWMTAVGADNKDLFRTVGRMNMLIANITIVCTLLIILFSLIIARNISGPLGKLTTYAKELVAHDFKTTDEMRSDVIELSEKYKDEAGALAGSFIFMERSLNEYLVKLKETTMEKERIESELNVARQIQMGILPKIFPAFPGRKEFDIHAIIEPAKEVGGDFYDFFFIDDEHFCFAIGDVSGKGVPTSLFMAITKTLHKAAASGNVTPDEILTKVNAELSQNNENSMFVTIFSGILNTSTGEVLYANGGHNPPLMIRKSGEIFYLDSTGDLMVGALEGVKYRMQRLTLGVGDKIYLYTDGVTEAMNTRDELFSEERLMNVATDGKALAVPELSDKIMQEIVMFTDGAVQTDDITMMALRFNGNGGGA